MHLNAMDFFAADAKATQRRQFVWISSASMANVIAVEHEPIIAEGENISLFTVTHSFLCIRLMLSIKVFSLIKWHSTRMSTKNSGWNEVKWRKKNSKRSIVPLFRFAIFAINELLFAICYSGRMERDCTFFLLHEIWSLYIMPWNPKNSSRLCPKIKKKKYLQNSLNSIRPPLNQYERK